MLLSEMLDVELLEKHLVEGYVRKQTHPTLPLTIYGYTEKSVFEKRYDDVTLSCRGLIVNDETGKVVARPWKRFFNYGERPLEIDDRMPVEVTDKRDGSLGILYLADGKAAIATRGSFQSEQAIHATNLWYEKYGDLPLDDDARRNCVEDYTFLFEIWWPQNRIVLDYGDLDDLVLLGAVSIDYGFYMGPQEAATLLDWPGPVTEIFHAKTMAEAFAMPDRLNDEGVVVRSGTKMVKIKQEDYCLLHKIITNSNSRTVWEALSTGKPLHTLLETVPDEFIRWVEETAADLQAQYTAIYNRAVDDFVQHLTEDRKIFAAAAKKTEYPDLLFLLLDNKSEQVSANIWKKFALQRRNRSVIGHQRLSADNCIGICAVIG